MDIIYKKIMIFGRPGSGKSTFALHLHKILGIPLYHLDKYFFESNWVERDYGEFMRIQQQLVDNETWIIDGNSTKSLETRYSKADLVLYFNYSKWLCYYRVVKRLFNKNNEIDDRAPGCNEKIGFSLLKYMWGFETRVKGQIRELKLKYPNVQLIEIKNDNQLNQLKQDILKRF